MTFKEYLKSKMIKEEYTYMYDKIHIDPPIHKIKYNFYDIDDLREYKRGEAIEYVNDLQTKLFSYLKLFHEFEYKYSKLKMAKIPLSPMFINNIFKLYAWLIKYFMLILYRWLDLAMIVHGPFKNEYKGPRDEYGEIYRLNEKIYKILIKKPTKTEDMFYNITMVLNTFHMSGKFINYTHITEEQLKQLSNLSTHKWDKELEQEFGI